MEIQFNHRKFREIRKAKHMSQMRLAELAETSDRYVRSMERGCKTNPSAKLLYRFCLILGEPVETFLLCVKEDDEA